MQGSSGILSGKMEATPQRFRSLCRVLISYGMEQV